MLSLIYVIVLVILLVTASLFFLFRRHNNAPVRELQNNLIALANQNKNTDYKLLKFP